MLKCSSSFIIHCLVKMFNAIWNCGMIPRSYGKSIMMPLHKKGSYSDSNNYRDFSSTSILSQFFLHFVHSRLQKWPDWNDIIVQEQAGFRKEFSRQDNIFAFHRMIEKYWAKHQKMCMNFLDFQKALGSVNRRALWNVLGKYGIARNISNVLK